VAFHPREPLFAAGFDDGTIRLWQLDQETPPVVLHRHRNAVHRLAFHPQKNLLASTGAAEDPTIRLWDLPTHQEMLWLQGHTGAVVSALWGEDGKTFLSAGAGDGTVRLWDMAASAPTAVVLPLQAPGIGLLHGIAATPDFRYLAAGNPDGTISILKRIDER
jgi:WD40 repeat protein